MGLDSVLPFLKSMRHEIVDFGNAPYHFPSILPIPACFPHHPKCWSSERIDVINNRIYLRCFITYVVKNDPENKKIRIPVVGVFLLVPESRNGEAVIESFEAYLDASGVFARVGEVRDG
jgi:hypothetical protein